MIRRIAPVLAALVWASGAVAQGLSGPSSVNAELEPGGRLDRSAIPVGFSSAISRLDGLPGRIVWPKTRFRFNIDYLALGQTTDADLGAGEAASGIARFYGSWQATEQGSLTFKVEHRHSYTDVAPQFLGLDGGALSITGTAFNDTGLLLTNLFWSQRAADGSWTLQFGHADRRDRLRRHLWRLVSPYSGFQNLSFNRPTRR